MRFDSLDEWLTWQEQLNPAEIELGLERVRLVLQRLNLEAPDFTVITIAGTNGKGSSAAMLQSIYSTAGYRVGAYTSPHLQRYNERITLNGVEADDALLCDAFEQIERARCAESGEVPLTYFEFGTLAAIVIFQQAEVDIAVLEVGLGGRLDAVNVLEPDVALVTMVDIDHQSWLGNDRETIAREKAGIYRANTPAICAEPAPARSLVAHAAEIGADYYGLNEQFSYGLNEAAGEGRWHWRSLSQRHNQSYEQLPPLGLHGAFQLQNAAGVLMAVTLLQSRFAVEEDELITGLKQAQLAGRLQRVVIEGHANVECLLDVAHNPSGAKVLREALAARPCDGETHAVVAMLADKEIGAVVEVMLPVVDHWYVAGLDSTLSSRGAAAAVVASSLPEATPALSFADVGAATAAALQKSVAGDRLVIFGSFYTVAEAKSFFEDVGCCEAN